MRVMFSVLVLSLLLTACGGSSNDDQPEAQATAPAIAQNATITPDPNIPTATSRFSTSIPREARPTLPPSWTPTPTASATPTPTITLTPSATNTATITPTRTRAEICENFYATALLSETVAYTTTDEAQYFIGYDGIGATIDMVAVNQDTDEEMRFNFDGGAFYEGALSMEIFPGPGRYELTFTLNTPQADALCREEYAFTIRELSAIEVLVNALSTVDARNNPTEAPTETPGITPSSTQQVLRNPIELTLDALVFGTATPIGTPMEIPPETPAAP